MPLDLLSTLLRGLGFIAILQAGGALLFVALLGTRLAKTRRAILQLARMAAASGTVLLIAQYVTEPARMAGALSGVMDAGLHGYLLHTRTALVMGLRLGGLLLAWLALRNEGAWVRGLGTMAAMLIAASFATTGHTAQNPLWWWLTPLLTIHVLIVQFWFGSLLPLLQVVRRESPSTAALIVQRFSGLAAWSVPVILVAGLLMAAGLLPNAAALGQPYGIGLLIKILAFAALMALAATNKLRLGPALAQDSTAAARLRFNIGLEFVLIAAVLMGTAALTTFWSPE